METLRPSMRQDFRWTRTEFPETHGAPRSERSVGGRLVVKRQVFRVRRTWFEGWFLSSRA